MFGLRDDCAINFSLQNRVMAIILQSVLKKRYNCLFVNDEENQYCFFLSAIYKYLWEISRANTGRKPSADNSGTSATGRNIVHISSLSLELYNLVLHSWCISIWVWYDSRILHKTSQEMPSQPHWIVSYTKDRFLAILHALIYSF